MRARLDRRGRGSRRSFSLLELVTVLLLIAVITAIAAPRYSGALDRYRVEAASRRIEADLEQARRRARGTGAPVTVAFSVDPGPSEYSINGLAEPYKVILSDEPYGVRVVSALFAGDALLVYDGYGVPDSDGSVVVGSGAAERTVLVTP